MLIKLKRWFLGIEGGLLLVIIAGSTILIFTAPNFFTLMNILNISRQMAIVSIIAVGELYVIITGEIDLSVGSTFGLVALVTALLILKGWSYPIAILVGLLMGISVGAFNGVLVTKAKLPSFIATLGTLMIGRGLSLGLTGGWPQTIYGTLPPWFAFLGQGRVLRIPVQAIIMTIILIIGFFILSKTVIGYHLYSVGGNSTAAHLLGISVTKNKIFAFVLTGFLAAVAGVVALAFTQTSEPNLGTFLELDVITAVIVGGGSILGGRGSILGIFFGSLIVAIINNAIVLLGIGAYYQKIFIGAIIIVAVSANTIKNRSSRK